MAHKRKGANPPFQDVIPANMDYLRQYTVDSASIDKPAPTESNRSYKRRICITMYYYSRDAKEVQEMPIIRIWPSKDWTNIWHNINNTPIPERKRPFGKGRYTISFRLMSGYIEYKCRQPTNIDTVDKRTPYCTE
jgi:hypothetical protein